MRRSTGALGARILGGIVCLSLVGASTAAAQRMREFSTARQRHNETVLATRLEYAAGTLRLQPAGGGTLYRMRLAYDDDRYAPESDFNAAASSVSLGLRATGEGGIRVSSREQLDQTAVIELSPEVDLLMDLTLGAVDADLELGGLRVRDLRLKTGASRTVIHFSRPNLTGCRRAAFSVGAAEFTALGLGNSGCETIRFEGGIGKVILDFSGSWPTEARAAVTMAVGDLTLRLPRHLGIRIMMARFLSSFDPAGLVRRGSTYLSPGYTQAARRLDIDLTAALGGVTVEWVE